MTRAVFNNQRSALVLGATGGIGGAIAAALIRRGWAVRGLVRDREAAVAGWRGGAARPEFIAGDAMVRDQVIAAACEGGAVSAIVHAVNPAGYRNWDTLVLPMLENSVAAARAAGGARIVLPGTVYNYDPATTPVIDAETPQNARTRKGRIRIAMEERLMRAAPEVPALMLRAGDFFGPGTRSSWFAQAMVTPGKPLRKITSMAPGVPHAYAFLPDLAETFAQLLDRSDRLEPFEVLQFAGHWDASGTAMRDAIRRAAGRDLPGAAFPWWLMRLAAPFGGFPREAREIEPVWRHPMRLDNRRLLALLGTEPHTPLDEAVAVALADLGCTDRRDAQPARLAAHAF